MRLEGHGLRVILPAERQALAPVSLVSKFAIRGNFEITATYQIHNAAEPESGMGTGFGVGVTIRIEKVHPLKDAATVGWVLRPGGKKVAVWNRAYDSGEEKPKVKGGEVPMSAASGRLRLKRVGPKLEYLVAKGTEEDFLSINQNDFGTEDLERVLLQVVTGQQKRAIDASWIDIRIKGDGLPTVAMPRGSASAFWIAVGVVGTIVLAAGGSRWHHRRKIANAP